MCPPTDAASLDVRRLKDADLLYFRLHGSTSSPLLWFGDGGIPAITPQSLDGVKLKAGAVVVIANCYGDTSPISRMFYEAGAGLVIAGGGPNYAEARRVVGTDRLVKVLIGAMRLGVRPTLAFQAAKAAVGLRLWRRADRDTLQFHILHKEISR